MPHPGEQHAGIPNPFIPATPHTAYTADEVAAIQCRLDKQLGPEYIFSRDGSGGNKFAYIPADKVINLANEVFGFNGWSTSIQNVTVDYVDESTAGKVSMGCSIVMRVTLKDGTYHEDIGYGEIRNAQSKSAAFEKTKKEAATDAMKRALRTFGNVLGNCVYDRAFLKQISKVRSAPAHFDPNDLHRPILKSALKMELAASKGLEEEGKGRQNSRALIAKHEDDEFGEDDFDDMDFAGEDAPISMDESPVKKIQSAAPAVPPQTAKHAGPGPPSTRHLQQPTNGNEASAKARLQQQTSQNQQVKQNTMQPPIQVTQNGATTTPAQSNGQAQNRTTDQQESAPAQLPQGAPLTFYRASAAPHLTENQPMPRHEDVRPFDPRTPNQMRRTGGVDHSRSGPILRQAVQGAQTSALSSQKSGQDRAPNFVNPQADANRRIGMPGGGVPSPLSNKGSGFKPPSIANSKRGAENQNRPALVDVSNVQDTNKVENTSKKPRMSPEVHSGPENMTSKA